MTNGFLPNNKKVGFGTICVTRVDFVLKAFSLPPIILLFDKRSICPIRLDNH